MKLGIQRAPHQNARYFESTRQLLKVEIEIILNGLGVEVQEIRYERIHGLELLTLEVDAWSDAIKQGLGRVSNSLVVYEVLTEGLLKPLIGEQTTFFNSDLSSILKYQGKTNEDFTKMMVNIGVFSSRFAKEFNTDLRIFDPMCGRGTTLYEGLIFGYHASGIEVQKNEVLELNKYLLRYLKYNRLKHTHAHQNIVSAGKKTGVKYTVETSKNNEMYKAGDRRQIQYAIGDTREANRYYKKSSFHTMVTDLPYGVQHTGRGKNEIEQMTVLIGQALPEWHKLLKTGGTLVIAFNAQTLKRSELERLLAQNGFNVLTEAPYDQMSHWVEQAVTRDVIVGVKS